MKRMKLHKVCLTVLITLLILGMVSCQERGTSAVSPVRDKVGDVPSAPSPVPSQISNSPVPVSPDSTTDNGVSASPSPGPGQSNGFPAMAYSKEQLDLIASIAQCREQGHKQQALDTLEELIRLTNPSGVAFKQELNELWWEIMTDTTNIPQEPLTDAETRDIAAVAYLMHPVDCFFYPSTLPLKDLFSPMFLWYSTDMWIPMYGRDGWDKSTPDYYQPSDIPEDGGYVLTQEHVKRFTRDMFGVELFPFYDDYDDGNVKFNDGMFEVGLSDYIFHDLLVSGYRYLGDGLYYVVLDGDDSGLPGAEEGRAGIIPDFMHLVVKRSHSMWGFTVVAKLHDAFDDHSLLKENWTLPEDMTPLVNTPHYPVQ